MMLITTDGVENSRDPRTRIARAAIESAQEQLEKWERLLATPPAAESPIAAFADVILAETGD